MKKPSLRFRQVFEHPTHFKVTKPLGNPLVIAKKGLSPSLMGRLRKFATEGEVLEPTEQDKQNLADLARESLSDLSEGMAAPGYSAPALHKPEIPFYQAEKYPASMSDAIAALPESPSLGSIKFKAGMESDLDTIEKLQDAYAEESARSKPDENYLADIKNRFTQLAGAQPVSPVGPPAPMDMTAPTTEGKVAPTATTEEAASTSTVAEPAAKAVAEPATEEPVAPKPAEEAAPKPSPMLDALKLMNISQDQLAAMTPMQRTVALTAAQQIMARQELAKIDLAAADAEAGALKDKMGAQVSELELLNKRAREARDAQTRILDKMDYLENPTDYFSSLGTLRQIGSALSVAMGAFASGMTGMPNFALKIYENAVERDLNQQKLQQDSLRNRLIAAGHTAEGADELVRAQMKLIAASEAGVKAASIKLPQVKAKIALEQAKLVNDATAQMAKVAQQERMAGVAERRALVAESGEARAVQEAPLRKKRLLADIDAVRLKQKEVKAAIADRDRNYLLKKQEIDDRREERKEKAKTAAEQDRIERGLTIGDADLELKSTAGAKDVRDNIAAREQAMMSIMKLESLFQEAGLMVYNPLSEARTEAIEELSTFIEQYPKAAGFKRAISLSAAKQLKEGLQNPAGGLALVKKLLGADPITAITGIRREVQRSYADQVKSVVRNPQSDEVNNAILSAYETAQKEIKKYELSNMDIEGMLEGE